MRVVLAYVAATAVTYALAAIASTQSVVASLRGMNMPVSTVQRVEMSWHDLLGMSTQLLPLIAAALLLAFGVTALLRRWIHSARGFLFALAGAVALLTLHGLLKAAFGITAIAAARDFIGLVLQASAGAIGGYLFARLSESHDKPLGRAPAS